MSIVGPEPGFKSGPAVLDSEQLFRSTQRLCLVMLVNMVLVGAMIILGEGYLYMTEEGMRKSLESAQAGQASEVAAKAPPAKPAGPQYALLGGAALLMPLGLFL